ncbi:MAG: hypothetical protein ACPG4T_22535, partial [Nannocystaceae bacterium]
MHTSRASRASQARTRWVQLGLCLMCATGAACDAASVQGPVPPAEVYGQPSKFAGVWFGESAGVVGELTIKPLSSLRYYGTFVSDDETVRFVLNMTQETADPPAGGT